MELEQFIKKTIEEGFGDTVKKVAIGAAAAAAVAGAAASGVGDKIKNLVNVAGPHEYSPHEIDEYDAKLETNEAVSPPGY